MKKEGQTTDARTVGIIVSERCAGQQTHTRMYTDWKRNVDTITQRRRESLAPTK